LFDINDLRNAELEMREMEDLNLNLGAEYRSVRGDEMNEWKWRLMSNVEES
jgi:hypothetical protein